ncbi:hypothetical protein [Pseudomonas caricapapayae]|uniref:hypothetical protein n=1 Tax=Pseudomonas caricapapayae TaxID=46678 RepID=UPI0006D5E557|nr:hypothetical protein [Pseudomonas caricapapayae]KAA8689551.1 hypothetical protein F4W67_27385 [Pseudomonas caricapapayae]
MKPIDGQKVKHSHEQIGDEVHAIFEYKGKRCRIAPIDHPSARATAAFQAIWNDVNFIHASLSVAYTIKEKLENEKELNTFDLSSEAHLIISNIYTSSIVTYAKLFDNTSSKRDTTQEKGRNAKLERSNLIKLLNEDQVKLHDKIITLRHAWAAHGGASNNESINAVMVFDPHHQELPAPLYLASYKAIPSTDELQAFRDICQPLLKLSEAQRGKSELKFIKSPFTVDFLNSLFEASRESLKVHSLSEL